MTVWNAGSLWCFELEENAKDKALLEGFRLGGLVFGLCSLDLRGGFQFCMIRHVRVCHDSCGQG